MPCEDTRGVGEYLQNLTAPVSRVWLDGMGPEFPLVTISYISIGYAASEVTLLVTEE